MALKIQNSRQLLKRSTVSGATPTVFTGSTDYTDGTWGVDDIYVGELYLNMTDKKLWFGWETSGGTGVELIYPQAGTPGPTFTGGSGNCITDFYLTNMYGCSPITIWDDFIIQSGVTINSFNSDATITMDSGGNSVIFLDLLNQLSGNTVVRLRDDGRIDINTDDPNNSQIIEYLPDNLTHSLSFTGGNYNWVKEVLYDSFANKYYATEQLNDGGVGNILIETNQTINATTNEGNYNISVSDGTPGTIVNVGKDYFVTQIGTGTVPRIVLTADTDVELITSITGTTEQSYHRQFYKNSTGLYQNILAIENTPNDTSTFVDLQTPNTGASILTMGMASGTTYSQMRFGPAVGGLPTAYADIRVSATTEGYIEVEEDLITISPALNVIGTITGTSYYNIPFQLVAAASDETTAITTGTTKLTFRMPCKVELTEVRASLTTAQTSGSTFTVDINSGGTSILSTLITIDNTEKTSTTAATPPVISTPIIDDDAEMTVDVDVVGSGTATGLKVTLIGKQI